VLEMSNLIITSGSEGSELSALYMAERILAQWEAPSWRPAVCRNFSYVDVNILEIGPLTVCVCDSGGSEVGETATPACAANDGPETTRRTVFVCRFL
jgi:hypothetical protein